MIETLTNVESGKWPTIRSKEHLQALDFDKKKSFYTYVCGRAQPYFKSEKASKKQGMFERHMYLPWHDFSMLFWGTPSHTDAIVPKNTDCAGQNFKLQVEGEHINMYPSSQTYLMNFESTSKRPHWKETSWWTLICLFFRDPGAFNRFYSRVTTRVEVGDEINVFGLVRYDVAQGAYFMDRPIAMCPGDSVGVVSELKW